MVKMFLKMQGNHEENQSSSYFYEEKEELRLGQGIWRASGLTGRALFLDLCDGSPFNNSLCYNNSLHYV